MDEKKDLRLVAIENHVDLEFINVSGLVKTSFEYIGEGYGGDFDPEDESDAPLIRFNIWRREKVDDAWEQAISGSACTAIIVGTDPEWLRCWLRIFSVEAEYLITNYKSVKRLVEAVSWLNTEFTLGGRSLLMMLNRVML